MFAWIIVNSVWSASLFFCNIFCRKYFGRRNCIFLSLRSWNEVSVQNFLNLSKDETSKLSYFMSNWRQFDIKYDIFWFILPLFENESFNAYLLIIYMSWYAHPKAKRWFKNATIWHAKCLKIWAFQSSIDITKYRKVTFYFEVWNNNFSFLF